MFEEYSPEAEQAVHTAHNHTFTITRDDIVNNMNDFVANNIDWSYATTTSNVYYAKVRITDLNGVEDQIAVNNLRVQLQDNEVYLVNDSDEKIHLCGAESSETKLQTIKDKIKELPETDPIARLVKSKIIEVFAEGGVQIEKI